MNVHQVLAAAGPVDAVTNQGLAFRRLFDSWGWGGADWAGYVAADMPRGAIRPLRRLRPGNGDVVLVHYSGYAPAVDASLDLGAPALLLSHNVTPAHWFWEAEPVEGVRCAIARERLVELARRARAAAGVSDFNARELRAAGVPDVDVVPVLFDRAALPPRAGAPPGGPPTILFVGRLAPHKRQDLVIRAFAHYRRRHAPDARLVLVGVAITPEFGDSLRELADAVAPGAVTIEGPVAPEALWERYREASAFLCLSEHEGFCIPLLEAFHFGAPVVARAAGSIPEVVGDAGLLLDADDDVHVAAEALHLAVSDQALRAELDRAAARRLDAYAYDAAAARVRAFVERAA